MIRNFIQSINIKQSRNFYGGLSLSLIADQLNCPANCGTVAVCRGTGVCERCCSLRCCNGCRRYLSSHSFDDDIATHTGLCQVGDYY